MPKDYIEFQDSSAPLAYLITFRCYGTWLHGDERGAINRQHNRYGTPRLPANSKLKRAEEAQLRHPPVTLDERQRPVVEKAIGEVCVYRHYQLYAVEARTNHVHCVVTAAGKPEPVMNAFKAYATRNLREAHLTSPAITLWERHGSTRYLWTPRHLELAVDYVINGQGDELPDFDE